MVSPPPLSAPLLFRVNEELLLSVTEEWLKFVSPRDIRLEVPKSSGDRETD